MVTARFDVFRNPSGSKTHPYVVVVQHDLLDRLPTRMVIPLVRRDQLGGAVVSRLNPECVIDRRALVLLTQQMGAVRASELTKRVTSLADRGAEIVAALDVLFSGV